MNPVILTASGRFFEFRDPAPQSIHLADIARSLSRICRFTGHTTKFYSVAQHSVLVSECLPRHLQLQGLLHDAAEAYLGDVSSPLKQLLPEYKTLERRVEAAIADKFGLPLKLDPMVKYIDLRLLVTERRDLMPAALNHAEDVEAWEWLSDYEPIPHRIVPKSPDDAYQSFIDRYLELV